LGSPHRISLARERVGRALEAETIRDTSVVFRVLLTVRQSYHDGDGW
jgi:hypothetical protein